MTEISWKGREEQERKTETDIGLGIHQGQGDVVCLNCWDLLEVAVSRKFLLGQDCGIVSILNDGIFSILN